MLQLNRYRFNSQTPTGSEIYTSSSVVNGFVCDHNRTKLGSGHSTYKEAIAALKQWQQFELGWVRICTPQQPVAADSIVCLCVNISPVWALFACKVVYLVEEDSSDLGPIKKFGFAYGTLDGHPESGEERFLVEWDTRDDSVWYDILAYSKPGNFLVALAKPFARLMQKRFARNSMEVMRSSVGSTSDNS